MIWSKHIGNVNVTNGNHAIQTISKDLVISENDFHGLLQILRPSFPITYFMVT